MKTKIYLTISLAVFALTVARAQTTSQQPDSLQYIEKILGITFETTSAKDGGVKVIKIEKGKWPVEKVINLVSPMKGSRVLDKRIEIKNTSDLTKAIFELRKNNYTKVVLYTKGKFLGLQRDISEINPNFSKEP